MACYEQSLQSKLFTIMTDTNASSSKRRRTSPLQSLYITDLPDGIFADVAKYLAKPSIACFIVAMTEPSEPKRQPSYENQQQANHIKQLTSSSSSGDRISPSFGNVNWDVLDFGDIEESLAANLSDNDVHSILMCIDAFNNLKTLKLTGCVLFPVVD